MRRIVDTIDLNTELKQKKKKKKKKRIINGRSRSLKKKKRKDNIQGMFHVTGSNYSSNLMLDKFKHNLNELMHYMVDVQVLPSFLFLIKLHISLFSAILYKPFKKGIYLP